MIPQTEPTTSNRRLSRVDEAVRPYPLLWARNIRSRLFGTLDDKCWGSVVP
jgi:hypothetical protein